MTNREPEIQGPCPFPGSMLISGQGMYSSSMTLDIYSGSCWLRFKFLISNPGHAGHPSGSSHVLDLLGESHRLQVHRRGPALRSPHHSREAHTGRWGGGWGLPELGGSSWGSLQ